MFPQTTTQEERADEVLPKSCGGVMGGYGSTRWGWRSTRATTDEFLALDVRALARRGYFSAEAGAVATGIEAWSCDGEEVGRVGVHYRGEDPHVITLEYRVRRSDEDGHTIRERV